LREKAEAFVRQILEEAQPLGKATAGPEPTLSALQNHQMNTWSSTGSFKPKAGIVRSAGTWARRSSKVLPFVPGKTSSTELREAIVLRAQSQGIDLSFTERFSPLEKAGGIGAMLKFNISGRRGR